MEPRKQLHKQFGHLQHAENGWAGSAWFAPSVELIDFIKANAQDPTQRNLERSIYKKKLDRIVMKFFYFLILPVLLTGCFGIVAKGGYDVATDQRPVGKQMNDAEIWGQIEKDLQQSSVEGTDKINVFCRNGIVVLAGVVANGSGAGTEAVRNARRVQGVKKVETYFLPSQHSRISDFEVKEKIHFKMVGDSDLKADQVDMTVIDGHVVLIGVVSSSAKLNKIIAIAHATEGVKAVKSFIQVGQ